MLHSKVYYMEYRDGSASVFIGSHNLTAFAMGGLNGEASILLEGEKDSTEFEAVRQHIANARKSSRCVLRRNEGSLRVVDATVHRGYERGNEDSAGLGDGSNDLALC